MLVLYQTGINRPANLEPLRRQAIMLGWGSSTEDLLLTQAPPSSDPASGSSASACEIERQIEADQNAVVTYHLYDVTRRRMRATLKGRLRSWAAPGICD